MIPITISVIIISVFLLVTSPLTHGEEPFFSIALSKFGKEEDAQKEEAKLKNSGNNAFYKKEKNKENGNIEYQVYIEKYKSMEEAIKEAKVLKELELISNYLVKEVVDTPIIEEPLPEAPLEGADTPQPDGDTKQVPEAKTGLPEKKLPVPEVKIIEGQTPLTAKKDTAEKIPETTPVKQPPEQKPAEAAGQIKGIGQKDAEKKIPVAEAKEAVKILTGTESKKTEAPLPQAVKKEDEKKASEAAPKEPVEKTGVTGQEKTSGQIRREPIPVKQETVKQAPEPKPLIEKKKVTSAEPGVGDKPVPKEEPPEIKRDETLPEKIDRVIVNQTPSTTVPVPEKVPEKKIPASVEITDQAKGATLQVGAYKEEANAAILKKQLITLGRKAFYRHETAGGMGDIFRIYITGYSTLGDAVRDAKALVESGVITGYARPNMKNPAADIPPQKTEAAANETGNSIYLLHTGSYKEEVNALRAVAMLKESGYKAIYVPEKDATVTWYRVYIGDFRSEAQAREKGMELLEKGIITYFKPVAITPEEKGN
jgi:hypothetical protein